MLSQTYQSADVRLLCERMRLGKTLLVLMNGIHQERIIIKMTSFCHKRARVNGVNLHYVTAGEGPVVLCMHGWPQNHREFIPVIEALGDRYRFIAPDLRGFADSDKPFDGY